MNLKKKRRKNKQTNRQKQQQRRELRRIKEKQNMPGYSYSYLFSIHEISIYLVLVT